MPAEQKKTSTAQFDVQTLGALLKTIDPSITSDALAGLVKAAGGDSTAIQLLFGQLNKLLLGGSSSVDAAELQTVIDDISAAGVAGKIVSLAGADSSKIAAMANAEIGVRYALIQGLPFAITGNPAIYDSLNRDGSLFKFDPNTGEKITTDEWFKDRAQFLAVKFNAAGESTLSVSGTQSWTFEERTDGGSNRIQVNADQGQRAAAKMIFATGTTQTQTIVGSASGDHIYSGSGDDNIDTGAGDDYVEGGGGGDMISGGRGNDTLLGGIGDDQLDGGVGDDKLSGGAGADYLVGGQGNDRLDGGNGFDTYVIDSGDGADTIIDADGQGEIILDGQTLTGSASFQDGKYKSADGKYTFSFAGDPEEGGMLVISSETGSIKLSNFKNGALGIKLGDGTANALISGVDSRELLDLWGGNRFMDVPVEPIDRISPVPPVEATTGGRAYKPVANDVEYQALNNVSNVDIETASANRNAVPLEGQYAELFSDPLAQVPLVTGASVASAIDMHLPSTPAQTSKSAGVARQFLFGESNAEMLASSFATNDAGVNPRQIEYALMDFHNAISLGGGLGGENLGDATSIGVGTLAIGGSLDKPTLSDDRYTDLGSKKIGVKG